MTAQVHERLISEGEETSMAFCPPLPRRHPRIRRNKGKLDEEESILRSTACWRGYQGTWEIREGRFYLRGLEGRFALDGSEPLFAKWFSGVLRVPRGERLEYVHMGFGSVYEEEVHIKIENGLVLETRVIDNRGKSHDGNLLGWQNLPGFENLFEGDGRPPVRRPSVRKWIRRIFG